MLLYVFKCHSIFSEYVEIMSIMLLELLSPSLHFFTLSLREVMFVTARHEASGVPSHSGFGIRKSILLNLLLLVEIVAEAAAGMHLADPNIPRPSDHHTTSTRLFHEVQ